MGGVRHRDGSRSGGEGEVSLISQHLEGSLVVRPSEQGDTKVAVGLECGLRIVGQGGLLEGLIGLFEGLERGRELVRTNAA